MEADNLQRFKSKLKLHLNVIVIKDLNFKFSCDFTVLV